MKFTSLFSKNSYTPEGSTTAIEYTDKKSLGQFTYATPFDVVSVEFFRNAANWIVL